ncbi:endolytic transglycosylase MltG [Silvibacterium acidisoli]|uniref:endolytic transglycosylase MltG n=1 Tax=Acidobacteriaceae bacterium ZG23-2 TaxID=2883246 RepID=UPI00406C11D9
MRRLFLLLVFVVIAWVGFSVFVPAGPTTETFVEIPTGTPGIRIAALLKQQGIIRSKDLFEAMHLIKGGTLKAGEYRFDHPAKMAEVFDRLRRGDVYTVAVTVPEGSNLFDIAQRLEAARLGGKDAFMAAARTHATMVADLDPQAQSLEGYLFPDTYHFPRSATALQIVSTMVRRFRQETGGLGLTAGNYHHVVTLASLVERETPIPAERPLVASVFENRLSKEMPLMTDPSVIYAALLDGRYRGTIYASDLQADSPYNTYRHPGLPPGPICNPGLVSLKAAMTPAQTNYLYFVAASADPSGKSKFSATLEEHTHNVQEYRKSLHEAGAR